MCQQLGTRLAVIDHTVQQNPLLQFALAGIPNSEVVSLSNKCMNYELKEHYLNSFTLIFQHYAI